MVVRPDEPQPNPSPEESLLGVPGEGVERGWETYSEQELDRILPRFDLGRIASAHPYRRGSRSAPKLKIVADRGEFLLKRRSIHRHPVPRIRFAHALQAALGRQGFPIAPLLSDRITGDTMVVAGDFAYELFRFVAGDRFEKGSRGASRAGDALARLHRYARDVDASMVPPASFHNSPVVREALHRLPHSIHLVEQAVPYGALQSLADDLEQMYERAVREITDLSFATLRPAIVHGDWHPGNVIYQQGMSNLVIAAVIDFDSARSEPLVTEMANGMAQFSIRGDGSISPLEWPADFDANRMQAFLHAYLAASDRPMTMAERSMIPWLIIEAIIAESAIPVANQGAFADLSGSGFMDLVRRKCEWVRQHRKAIAAL